MTILTHSADQLFHVYPGIRKSLISGFAFALPLVPAIRETVSPKMEEGLKLPSIIRSLTGQSGTRLKTGGVEIVRSVTAQLTMPAEKFFHARHLEMLGNG